MSALLAVPERSTARARRSLILVPGEDLLRLGRPLVAVLVHLFRVPPVVLDLRQVVALDAGEVLAQREVPEAVDRLLPFEAGGPLDEDFRAGGVRAALGDRHAAGEQRAAFLREGFLHRRALAAGVGAVAAREHRDVDA